MIFITSKRYFFNFRCLSNQLRNLREKINIFKSAMNLKYSPLVFQQIKLNYFLNSQEKVSYIRAQR